MILMKINNSLSEVIYQILYTSLCLIIFISLAFRVEAKIVKINSINEEKFTAILRQVDDDTIVLIEVDGAITQPMSAMFSRNANPYRNFINNLSRLSHKDSFYSSIIASWYQQRAIKLTENEWPNLIKDLQSKGAKVFGLYSTPIQLMNIEQKIIAELQNFGIKFTPSIVDKSEFIIKKREAWVSHFYNGIISVGPYSRVNSIIEFLRLTYLPRKIIIISNLSAEINNIEAKLRVFNMKFYNIEYLGNKNAEIAPKEEIVKFQQQQLIENKKWIEDAEAAKMLNIK
jgi:hypothetical protein